MDANPEWAAVIAQISGNVEIIAKRLVALEQQVKFCVNDIKLMIERQDAMDSRTEDDEPDMDGKTASEHTGDHQRLWENRP